MSFVVVAKFQAKPDSIAALTELITQTAIKSWEEPGLLKYILVSDDTQPDRLTLVEFFESEAAYLFHRDSSYLANFREQVSALIASPPEVVRGVPALVALNPKAGIN